MNAPLRVLLVGHGRMGRLVESLAPEYGTLVTGTVTSANASAPEQWPQADVAIDFSTAAAVVSNARTLSARGTSMIIGTTGWHDDEAALREAISGTGVGILAAPNFAIGVNLFLAIAEQSARMLVARGFSPWIHEAHHAAKKDAPSGTAVALHRVVEAGARRWTYRPRGRGISPERIQWVSTRRRKRSRSRTWLVIDAVRAGALEAARWIHGRQGWFTMRDLLAVEGSSEATLNANTVDWLWNGTGDPFCR